LTQPLVESRLGLHLALSGPGSYELGLLGGVLGAALLAGAIPAYRAYRLSLSDGLTIRV
jgi:putative ABC transport system permease protein